MTAAEMKYEFQIKNELIADLSNPDLEDDEISLFLNNAQIKIVEELYKASKIEFISELVVTLNSEATASYTGISNAKAYTWTDKPEDYMFFISAAAKLTRTNPTISSAEWVECDKIKNEIAYKFATNGFNIPWFKNPKVFLDGNLIVVLYDSYTTLQASVDNLQYNYIKKPTEIDIAGSPSVIPDLREFLHMDIVNKAIEMVMESYENNDRTRERG